MASSWRWFPAFVALAAGCAAAPNVDESAGTGGAKRPNILLVLIDDLGFEAVGAYGGASYETPNIDRLAADGVRFAHAYSTPLCAPSRLKLLTGRYNSRNYTEWGVLPPDEVTVANLLQDTGYATFMAGKWQMSGFEQVWAPEKDGDPRVRAIWSPMRRTAIPSARVRAGGPLGTIAASRRGSMPTASRPARSASSGPR